MGAYDDLFMKPCYLWGFGFRIDGGWEKYGAFLNLRIHQLKEFTTMEGFDLGMNTVIRSNDT